MAKYRNKPVVIDAEPYREGLEDGFIYRISNGLGESKVFNNAHEGLETFLVWHALYDDIQEKVIPYINTLEGKMEISFTDYIITGVCGERYPIKKDIFEETYELVED